jgi:hypothetical protein
MGSTYLLYSEGCQEFHDNGSTTTIIAFYSSTELAKIAAHNHAANRGTKLNPWDTSVEPSTTTEDGETLYVIKLVSIGEERFIKQEDEMSKANQEIRNMIINTELAIGDAMEETDFSLLPDDLIIAIGELTEIVNKIKIINK